MRIFVERREDALLFIMHETPYALLVRKTVNPSNCAGIHSDRADKLTRGIFARLDTILSFTQEPTCGGSILSMEHSGYKGVKHVIISLIMQMGWKKQVKKKLPKVLEQMTND